MPIDLTLTESPPQLPPMKPAAWRANTSPAKKQSIKSDGVLMKN